MEDQGNDDSCIDPVLFQDFAKIGDTQTSMNYDFISNDDEQDDNQMTFDTVGSMWTLGDHSTASDAERNTLSNSIQDTMAQLDDEIDGEMKAVLQDASNLVEDTSVSRFECPVEACGLGHSHPDHKHDIRAGFDVIGSFADQMDFCPYCHCGVNELSMLMQFFGYISEPVFEDQHQFEGVLEIEPGVLDSLYRRFNENGLTVREAIRTVASDHGVAESDIAGHGVRSDLEQFFTRRRDIENAANSAPIAQETRNQINENREALEEATQ